MKYILILSICSIILYVAKCNKSTKELIIPEDALLVDVRTAKEFENGSAPNAINVPLGSIEFNLDEFSNQKDIIVFCRTGHRSQLAKKKLEKNGIQNVTNGGSLKDVKTAIKPKL